MPKKNPYNPSGKPVLTKGNRNKGSLLKNIDSNVKRLNLFKKRGK